MIYNEDCLETLKKIKKQSIDMIYLDPPFFTQKRQVLKNNKGKEYAFDDTWESRDDYLNFMRLRLIEMHRVLKNTGSIFLHCDSTASHYLRVLLDEIFGENNFQSEIVWTYKRWSNSKKGLLQSHQIILFYSKTNKFKFNTLYTSYSPTTNIDQILQERERNEQGKAIYKRDKNGNILQGKEKKGVPISDTWDIPYLNPKAKERVGYPTQKPIELLERIIRISTDEGDIVLDPFCGSGTTLVSAKLLNRKFIGIDINKDAIELTNTRLKNPFKTSSELLKKGKDAYLTKTKEELDILNQFDCDIVQRNKGIDAFLKKHYKNSPIALKIQKDNETVEQSIILLSSSAESKGCKITVLITNEYVEEKKIPRNMIVISKYRVQLENKIKNFENS